MRAQWVCSRERRIALYKRSSIINQSKILYKLCLLCVFCGQHTVHAERRPGAARPVCWCSLDHSCGYSWHKNIHEGGHIRSWNRKRGWVDLYWHWVIVTQLGQGRSRDRLRSVPSFNCGHHLSESLLTTSVSSRQTEKMCEKVLSLKTKRYTAVLVRITECSCFDECSRLHCQPVCKEDLESNVAFILRSSALKMTAVLSLQNPASFSISWPACDLSEVSH